MRSRTSRRSRKARKSRKSRNSRKDRKVCNSTSHGTIYRQRSGNCETRAGNVVNKSDFTKDSTQNWGIDKHYRGKGDRKSSCKRVYRGDPDCGNNHWVLLFGGKKGNIYERVNGPCMTKATNTCNTDIISGYSVVNPSHKHHQAIGEGEYFIIQHVDDDVCTKSLTAEEVRKFISKDDILDEEEDAAEPLKQFTGTVVKKPPDNSCFFHSMEHFIKEHTADKLREHVASFIETYPDAPLDGTDNMTARRAIELDTGMTPEQYARLLRNPTKWGGNPELLVLSHLFRIKIFLYRRKEGVSQTPVERFERYKRDWGTDDSTTEAHLLYDESHYDALTNLKQIVILKK